MYVFSGILAINVLEYLVRSESSKKVLDHDAGPVEHFRVNERSDFFPYMDIFLTTIRRWLRLLTVSSLNRFYVSFPHTFSISHLFLSIHDCLRNYPVKAIMRVFGLQGCQVISTTQNVTPRLESLFYAKSAWSELLDSPLHPTPTPSRSSACPLHQLTMKVPSSSSRTVVLWNPVMTIQLWSSTMVQA
jgi:hypothetical protein